VAVVPPDVFNYIARGHDLVDSALKNSHNFFFKFKIAKFFLVRNPLSPLPKPTD
jgi:hypothetical protein